MKNFIQFNQLTKKSSTYVYLWNLHYIDRLACPRPSSCPCLAHRRRLGHRGWGCRGRPGWRGGRRRRGRLCGSWDRSRWPCIWWPHSLLQIHTEVYLVKMPFIKWCSTETQTNLCLHYWCTDQCIDQGFLDIVCQSHNQIVCSTPIHQTFKYHWYYHLHQ